ncbi:MAG: dehydratase [Firmicutes bacterium]|nr:dehydratase [Bacillota bacterium]
MKRVGLEERAHREKPHIKVYRSAEAPLEPCREVELGLEEEGIPGVLSAADAPGAVDLAFSAAQASPLGTGIGIAADGLAVHFSRLPKEKPLFYIRRDECDPAHARHLGANAARLVKGIPFKEKEDTPPLTGSRAPEPVADEYLNELVARVVQRVLAEQRR